MQAALHEHWAGKRRSMKVPMMGLLCIGNREVARMPVGARWVSGWWESGPSAAVHGFGHTGEGPLKVRTARSGRGDHAATYRGV